MKKPRSVGQQAHSTCKILQNRCLDWSFHIWTKWESSTATALSTSQHLPIPMSCLPPGDMVCPWWCRKMLSSSSTLWLDKCVKTGGKCGENATWKICCKGIGILATSKTTRTKMRLRPGLIGVAYTIFQSPCAWSAWAWGSGWLKIVDLISFISSWVAAKQEVRELPAGLIVQKRCLGLPYTRTFNAAKAAVGVLSIGQSPDMIWRLVCDHAGSRGLSPTYGEAAVAVFRPSKNACPLFLKVLGPMQIKFNDTEKQSTKTKSYKTGVGSFHRHWIVMNCAQDNAASVDVSFWSIHTPHL